MKITFLSTPRVAVDDTRHFEIVVRAAFAQRRKKLVNSLMSTGRWTKERLNAALNAASISPDIRAEQLGIAEFARLARELR
jgi:16S rRNA (adenine1518-N6/adenine1519-N6)-dimethyltransferase